MNIDLAHFASLSIQLRFFCGTWEGISVFVAIHRLTSVTGRSAELKITRLYAEVPKVQMWRYMRTKAESPWLDHRTSSSACSNPYLKLMG